MWLSPSHGKQRAILMPFFINNLDIDCVTPWKIAKTGKAGKA
jgi:hypothetical protein